ncbi:MAG: hypothetical protein MSG64_01775 [Pyrinomonadaceae bacterium MAG19_C2-C3]|nr:hypothetical protein [Pyrinomonadaceae bacterium MAG19_C2-C3]
MITVILAYKRHGEIERVGVTGNEKFLVKEEADNRFPYLSELSTVDLDAFDKSDMNPIIAELERLKTNLNDAEQSHVEDILRLARRCRDNDECVLLFTPFGELTEKISTATTDLEIQKVA